MRPEVWFKCLLATLEMDPFDVTVIYMLHLIGYWLPVVMYYLRDQKRWSFKCATKVLLNQVLYTPMLMPLLIYSPTSQLRSINWIWQLPLGALLTDFMFYPLHRLLHHPKLYRYHAAHHTWENPIPVSALYADSFEHCVVNMLPPVLAMLFTGMNISVAGIWALLGSMNTVMAHAQEGQHTDHHRYRNCNYGVGLMLMDRLFNTYR